MQQAHVSDFAGFQIEFETTQHQQPGEPPVLHGDLAALRKAGLVSQREVTQLYDPAAGTFPGRPLREGDLP